MIDDFFKLLRNKVFLYALFAINTALFILGFYTDSIDMMLLAVASYAVTLLGLEYNKDFPDEEDKL